MEGCSPSKEHIRHCLLYEYRRRSSATTANANINEVYPNAVNVRTCQRWFLRFRSGDMDLNDKPRSGRPEIIDEEALLAAIEEDPRRTIQDLATFLNISWSTVQEHLHKLGKVWREGVWIPHHLTDSQREQRVILCTSLLSRHQATPFLHNMITCDEKWILFTNPHRHKQWLSPNQDPIPTPKSELHPKKVMLSVWWTIFGILHWELLEDGKTITSELYCEQLDRVNERLPSQPQISPQNIVYHHDNARPHSALATQRKIRSLGWDLLPHPPYSPDCAPSDYHLFRSMQHWLCDKTFQDRAEIQVSLTEYFASKDQSFFRSGIEKLIPIWTKIVASDGNYSVPS